jgi:hypothetical protein
MRVFLEVAAASRRYFADDRALSISLRIDASSWSSRFWRSQ